MNLDIFRKTMVDIWNKYGFEILVLLSLLIIIIIGLLRRGKRGSWADRILPVIKDPTSAKKPPQESRGEIECRKVLENIFKKPFIKTRPSFLRNSVTSDEDTDINLELDCYNEDLKIACEYNGIQHYKYNPFFHKTKDSFQNQKYRDYMKRDLCVKNGIKLIEVPYTVKIEDIESFIKKELN